MSKISSISAFFPCLNEEKNVPIMVEALSQLLPTLAKDYEIIIVNDGSTDSTKKVAQLLTAKDKHIKLVNHAQNLGYGASIISGIKKAQYEWIFYTDGDAQFNVQQLKSFLPHTGQYDIIIGHRQNRADGQLRALNAKLFKIFIDLLFRVHVKDIDCAFKLLKSETVKSLPLISHGAMVSAEMLYRLKKKSVPFKQLPVQHLPRQYGKPTGNNPKVIIKAITEALRLYAHMKFGPKIT
jgi:glycosyltransferase involved in cell wall biosynthesis